MPESATCAKCDRPAMQAMKRRRICRACLSAESRVTYLRRKERGHVAQSDPDEMVEKFLQRMNAGAPDECWEWTGTRGSKGYGLLGGFYGKQMGAHRVSYLLHYGDLPPGCFICHHCDNPPCVNPAHLYAGDRNTNARDVAERNRAHRQLGEASNTAKLTAELVREIRAVYATGKYKQRDMALHYGISQSQISNIVTRREWRHVT